jgi:hypothetical protein
MIPAQEQGFIFCTHRQLANPASEPDCTGVMRVDPDTEGEDTWVADCDVCGLEVGIAPRERARWLQGLPS